MTYKNSKFSCLLLIFIIHKSEPMSVKSNGVKLKDFRSFCYLHEDMQLVEKWHFK